MPVLPHPPLVIDLDGTLLRSDLLLETGLEFLRDQPQRCLQPLAWLARGKAELKQQFAQATELDVAVLPYDQSVLNLILTERARGRRVVLATASHRRLADRVAAHLGVFDEVLATEDGRNLSAETKRDVLVQAFGERGFDYVGNSRDDLPVWRAALRGYVANAAPALQQEAGRVTEVAGVLGEGLPQWRDWWQALRLHQWLKNLLLFVPLLAAHRYGDAPLLADALLAFLCFGMCASSVYILNDLLDLRDDGRHLRKRRRPFASGRLPVHSGLLVFPVMLLAAFGLALWQLPPAFVGTLAIYYGLTLAYSLLLKRLMVIDVMTLAALYTLRIIAGAMALAISLSFWLLAFSMFMFLSLAMVKRFAELYPARAEGNVERTLGRGYFPADLEMIASLGASAGYMAVMVLALYINDGDTTLLYRHQEIIWLACPLLLTWITRVWMLAHRGEMHDDPVIFAMRDRFSLVIGALLALVFWAAT